MEIYSYEKAFEESLKYFEGEELPSGTFLNKYALRNEKGELLESSPIHMFERIAREIYRIEKGKFKNPLSYNEIYDYIKDFKRIIPQGSPMSGIGNPYQYVSLSNCYVIDAPEDSYASIMKADERIVQLSKRRGGVGLDISKIRPKGMSTTNAAKTSTGIIPFMERYSNSIREVGQSGRRGALMISISVHHPEILDFVTIKKDLKKVTGANISVKVTNEFMEAVFEDKEYEQRFPVDSKNPIIKKQVRAKEIWEAIIDGAWSSAEPGVLFWDRIISESPADCYSDVGFSTQSTNPSLRKGTLVATDKGIMPIENLVGNDDIKVRNIKGEWHNCRAFVSGKNKQLIKITFSNNQHVYCTPEHKWPILNTSNNIINPQTGKVVKKRTDELKKQDKIYFPSFLDPVNNLNCNYSYEDGFVVGWNIGDGWTSYHKVNDSKQYGFIFSQEDIDSGIGNKVLSHTNKIAKKISSLRRDHDSKSFTYCTTDSSVLEFFEERGLINKKNGVPTSIFTGNSEYIKGFIDGLFSSDGYVKINDKIANCSIVLVSSHEKIISDVQKLLSFYGIRSSFRKSDNCNHKFPNGKNYDKVYTRYDLTISGINALKFSKHFSLSNRKKQNKLDELSNKKFTKNNKGRSEYANNREYLSISTVEKTDIYEDVYDITVYDDSHTFHMETGITGNCGEIPLCSYDSCRLLSLNLLYYVKNPYTEDAYFDYDLFRKEAAIAQRFQDDIIDLEIESLERIVEKIKSDPEDEFTKIVELNLWLNTIAKCKAGRRTGTGITALGDSLAALGIKYGSDESVSTVENIYKTLKLGCYDGSVSMAEEIGPFEFFNFEKEKNNPFLLRLKEDDSELYEKMKKYGRRNIACITTAPTGTVSMLSQTSSGIEPVFMLSYVRRRKINPNDIENGARVDFVDEQGDKWMEFEVYHPQVKKWMEITGNKDITQSPWYGCTANEINWENRVKLQGVANLHVCHSISATVNLPENVSKEEVAHIYETAYRYNLKGLTVYRNNCRAGVLVDKAFVKEGKISKNDATKRPKKLACDVYRITAKGQKYFVIIGLMNNEPYEIFAGKKNDDNFDIDNSIKRCYVEKVKRGKYSLISEKGDILLDSISECIDNEEEAITRLISSNLRHGCDVNFVVHQIEKTKGDMLSFTKVISRVLKKYIQDGSRVHGEACPNCKSDLVRVEGCISCLSCGWSRCG